MREGPTNASRRALLAAGPAAVVGSAALAGCEVYGDDPAPPPPPPPAEGTGDAEEGGSGGTVVASISEVDVGGGLILADQNLVITQPEEGTFRGFSATCTHQGCTVSSVSDGTINCACHGSRFSIEDGSVVQAATGVSADQQDPLPEAGITVDGESIELG